MAIVERGVELVTKLHGNRVVTMGTIEREQQPIAVAVDQHRRPVGLGVGFRWCRGTPRGEFRSALEHRVHGRFRGEGGRDRQPLGLPQEDGQGDRRQGDTFDLLGERGPVGGVERDVGPPR